MSGALGVQCMKDGGRHGKDNAFFYQWWGTLSVRVALLACRFRLYRPWAVDHTIHSQVVAAIFGEIWGRGDERDVMGGLLGTTQGFLSLRMRQLLD